MISIFYKFSIHFPDIFFCPEMTLPLRYGASVKDFTEKVKQELKGTKYVNIVILKKLYCDVHLRINK
jgi:hypothetical protein